MLPSVHHTLGQLGDAEVFTKLDANSGFHQIPLKLSSQLLATLINDNNDNDNKTFVTRMLHIKCSHALPRSSKDSSKTKVFKV